MYRVEMSKNAEITCFILKVNTISSKFPDATRNIELKKREQHNKWTNGRSGLKNKDVH